MTMRDLTPGNDVLGEDRRNATARLLARMKKAVDEIKAERERRVRDSFMKGQVAK